MSYIELFLLAAGLCFDTFAVSLTGGICTRGSLCVRQILRIIFCFAVFQAGLTFAGWLLGYSVSDYISKVDHWVAFVLLGYIGVKMIIEGCSKKEAKKKAEEYVAIPGTSEHQLGLSVDINADTSKCSSDAVYQWLDENAYKYGFVKRYPEDKTDITSINNEPWHYRYVGKDAARTMKQENLCLEEYLIKYK